MGFFRRLFGIPAPTTPETRAPQTPLSGQPPEIAAPDAPIDLTPPDIKVEQPPADAPAHPPEMLLYGATRQLPPLETASGKPGKHYAYGISSDVGVVRTNNQDALFTMFSSSLSADSMPDFGLFVVADGMGGHHDGERASALATRVVAEQITQNFYLKALSNAPDDERPPVSEVLVAALQRANEIVAHEIPEGGTTVTAALLTGDLVYVAHVGDSRAYLVTSDGAEQITRDHSLVQRLIELDQLTPDEAASHPQRNVLYRAIGQSEHIEIDTATRRLQPGCRLLLCSDGLWNQVPESEIVKTITTAPTPQDACDRLVSMANERGGNDNVTVVLILVPG